jgi:hypothetical protein
MTKKAPTVEVACPCCRARLTIDPQLGVVLSHEAPPRPAPNVDLDDTARLLREQAERREEHFRRSVEAEKKKEQVFDRLFEEGLKKAKDKPVEKPLRDFDLD